MKYRLYTYDLWGNEENGYDVNDIFASEITMDIGSDDYDETIIEKVRAEIPVQKRKKKYQSKDFRIEGRDTAECFIWITYKGVPFCEFRPEEEVQDEQTDNNGR